jgi:translation initiation factor 2 beta subunit (eIF-2beta)/eIF-5
MGAINRQKGGEVMKTTDLVWHTEKRKVKDLILFPGNPRKMSKKQAEQLIQSLKKFNYVEIVVIDQNNRVIAGNMRVQALKELGMDNEEIEVRVPNRPLTEEEAKEYLLRSNKNIGEWDYDLLMEFDENFLKDIGFDEKELSFLNIDVEDMLKDGFMKNQIAENSDEFSITFVFPKQYKEIIENKIKQKGKEYFVNLIIKECLCQNVDRK